VSCRPKPEWGKWARAASSAIRFSFADREPGWTGPNQGSGTIPCSYRSCCRVFCTSLPGDDTVTLLQGDHAKCSVGHVTAQFRGLGRDLASTSLDATNSACRSSLSLHLYHSCLSAPPGTASGLDKFSEQDLSHSRHTSQSREERVVIENYRHKLKCHVIEFRSWVSTSTSTIPPLNKCQVGVSL